MPLSSMCVCNLHNKTWTDAAVYPQACITCKLGTALHLQLCVMNCDLGITEAISQRHGFVCVTYTICIAKATSGNICTQCLQQGLESERQPFKLWLDNQEIQSKSKNKSIVQMMELMSCSNLASGKTQLLLKQVCFKLSQHIHVHTLPMETESEPGSTAQFMPSHQRRRPTSSQRSRVDVPQIFDMHWRYSGH